MSLFLVSTSSLQRAIALYDELMASLPENALIATLPGLPSNTLGQQLWCVVGARESYARAIRAGGWTGFSCSLTRDDCTSSKVLGSALSRSGVELVEALAGGEAFTDDQYRLVLDALGHEASHHGQLIRYLYALRLPIPAGWKSKYALD